MSPVAPSVPTTAPWTASTTTTTSHHLITIHPPASAREATIAATRTHWTWAWPGTHGHSRRGRRFRCVKVGLRMAVCCRTSYLDRGLDHDHGLGRHGGRMICRRSDDLGLVLGLVPCLCLCLACDLALDRRLFDWIRCGRRCLVLQVGCCCLRIPVRGPVCLCLLLRPHVERTRALYSRLLGRCRNEMRRQVAEIPRSLGCRWPSFRRRRFRHLRHRLRRGEGCALGVVEGLWTKRSTLPSARWLSYLLIIRSAIVRSENTSSATTAGCSEVSWHDSRPFWPSLSVESVATADSISAAVVPGAKLDAMTG